MIEKNALLEKFKRNQKKIKVKAWGEEVVIQQLSVKEKSEVESFILGDATPEELRNGTFKIGMAAAIESRILAVSYALVEPKMSVEDLNSLDASASEGLGEIYQAIEDFNTPKK